MGRKAVAPAPGAPSAPDMFTALLRADLGVDAVRELRFHPRRRWRFDYAIPSRMVAIEIDGGVWQYGRHNRASGYVKDMEKMNEAAALGWLVLHFTPQQQFLRRTLDLIRRAVECRKI